MKTRVYRDRVLGGGEESVELRVDHHVEGEKKKAKALEELETVLKDCVNFCQEPEKRASLVHPGFSQSITHTHMHIMNELQG